MGMTPQHLHTISASCTTLPPLTQICFVFASFVLWKAVGQQCSWIHQVWNNAVQLPSSQTGIKLTFFSPKSGSCTYLGYCTVLSLKVGLGRGQTMHIPRLCSFLLLLGGSSPLVHVFVHLNLHLCNTSIVLKALAASTGPMIPWGALMEKTHLPVTLHCIFLLVHISSSRYLTCGLRAPHLWLCKTF